MNRNSTYTDGEVQDAEVQALGRAGIGLGSKHYPSFSRAQIEGD